MYICFKRESGYKIERRTAEEIIMYTIYDRLREYGSSDYYGFHMPGHKRRLVGKQAGAELPYRMDITEIEGFDDLHHACGILKEAQERAARVFGADETHFLVNGSTAGILSAVCGDGKRGYHTCGKKLPQVCVSCNVFERA